MAAAAKKAPAIKAKTSARSGTTTQKGAMTRAAPATMTTKNGAGKSPAIKRKPAK